MSTADLDLPRSRPVLLNYGELVLLGMVAAIGLLTAVLAVAWGQPVDWPGFLQPVGTGLTLAALGVYARLRRGMVRAGLLMVGVSMYVNFGAFMSILIYLFFPIATLPIDATLMRIDAWVGFSWPDFVIWFGQFPWLGKALSYVYLSSLAQLMAVVVILAWMNRAKTLCVYVMTASLALFCIAMIWGALPSFGPSPYVTIPPDISAKLGLIHNHAYGARLMELATDGVRVITPDVIIGTIAFPSFHTVMACLVVWFLRGTPIFIPAALLNAAMVPAILLHGGHHLIDVVAGVAIFGLALAVSQVVMRPMPSDDLG